MAEAINKFESHSNRAILEGYLSLEFEGFSLYPSGKEFRNRDTKNAAWVSIVMEDATRLKEQGFENRDVMILGTLKVGTTGHFGMWPAEISNITKIWLIENQKKFFVPLGNINEEFFDGIRKQKLNVVKRLLDNGVNANAWATNGQTPLLIATSLKNMVISSLLLKAGASPNTSDKDGMTPIMAAASLGDVNLLKLLVKHGGKPTGRYKPYGWTTLHWSAANGHIEATKYILAIGADKTEKDNDGKTALDLAKIRGHNKIVSLLSGGK